MRKITAREIMTPYSEYKTIREDQTLYDAFYILEGDHPSGKPVHRDLMVVDKEGKFKGKVTMIDFFRALEPKYKHLNKIYSDGTLTKESVIKAMQDFDLWLEPVKDLCERGSNILISDVMHIPENHEYIQEDDSVEMALHEYVMGVHQPLMVMKDNQVTGALRFEDLYEVVRKHMLSCKRV